MGRCKEELERGKVEVAKCKEVLLREKIIFSDNRVTLERDQKKQQRIINHRKLFKNTTSKLLKDANRQLERQRNRL